MDQTICRGVGALKTIWETTGARKVFLVCGSSFDRLTVRDAVLPAAASIVRFSDFSPNPRYEDAERGRALFERESCEAILAVGGGSAIDTAKCVKLFGGADVPLIAVPTTAGTGSESTRHAVVYRGGVKQSICDWSILPDYAVLIPDVLENLPPYQKKCTMLDALCQGIESWWSVQSTDESIAFAKAAVSGIAGNWRRYIEDGDAAAAANIMDAANASGRAISITATTAPHAMSYKLTSLYGLPHGHAVALCMREVWPWLASHPEACADPRGAAHLKRTLEEIAQVLSFERFDALLDSLGMEYPKAKDPAAEADLLSAEVNPERLKNSPATLNAETLRGMYERILR